MPIRLDEIPEDVVATPLPQGAKAPSVALRLDELDSMQGEAISQKTFDFGSLNFSPEEANALKAKGKIGYFEQSIRMKKLEKVPILGLGVAVYEAAAVRRAFGRLQKDEYGQNKELKEHDINTARTAIRYAGEEQLRGYSWGGGFIEGASNLPAYMIEFAASSLFADPAGAAVLRGVTKGVATSALKQVTAQGAAWGTRAAVRTGTVFSPWVISKTYENEIKLNLVPTEKGLELDRQAQSAPFTSFTKALGDTAIEVFSEEAGAIVFNPALNKMAGAPLIKQVGEKMAALYKQLHPSESIGKLFTKAGWDGFVSEIGEEILGDQMRAVFNVSNFGMKDGNTLDRMIAAIPDGDEMMVMMGVLAVPGATNMALQGGVAALDDYRAKKRIAGQEVKAPRTFAGKLKQQGFDIVETTVAEALAPLPQVELSKEELEQLHIKPRGGLATFEASKPAPERKLVDEIISSQEFKEADQETKMRLLIKGRTAELDSQRIAIEDRMTALEKEVEKLSGAKEKISMKIVEGKKEELMLLSKELMSVHAQISDVVDSTAGELSREKVLLPGESLEQLRGKARQVGERMERARVETVFRNLKAQAEERRTALVKYLQARLPGSENAKLREKYNLRAAKDMTEEKLQKFFAEVEKLRETVRAKQLRERAESILDKMKSKIVDGVKKGVFANANIQTLADEVIRIAGLSAPAAEEELRRVHGQVVQLAEAGEGESEAAEELKYRAGLLSTISGLEQRNADQLEDAIRLLVQRLGEFQTGRDVVKELRKAQRTAEEKFVVASIKKITWSPRSSIAKLIQKAGKSISSLFHFSAFHLEEFWRELGINKMVAEPLAKISERIAAMQMKMDKPVREAANAIYGVPKENNRAYVKWLTERMSLDKSDDPNTAPYLKTVVLNDGKEKVFKLSRWDVMYWYASAYQEEGVVDPEAYEILTNENELQAIREQVSLEMSGEEGIDKEARERVFEDRVAERAAKIKGNAIPADVLEEMFGNLTTQDRRFAMELRRIFTSFWPLINPVYARATGVNMTHIESYMPRIRKTVSEKTIADMFTEFSLVEAHVTPFPGSVKERRSTSTAPFAQIGLMDVYMGFQSVMSHWIVTHDITARMQRYLKNRAIRDAINEATDGVQDKATGEWKTGSFVGLMDFHLKGIASRGRTDNNIRPPAMDLLRRNLSRAVLSKPRQALVQLTSTFAAIQKVGHIEFVKGLASFWRDPVGSIQLLNKALSLRNRYQNIMLEMKEVQDLIRLQQTRWRDKLNWFDKYAFFFTQVGDRAAIYLGGWTVFKSAYDKTKDIEKAYEAFDDFVYTLQQSALREHQTAATVGPNRYLFQFISAVAQYGRVYYRAWADLVREPSAKNIQMWARSMAIFHLYIPTALWYVSQLGTPPPEDEEEEKKRKKQLLAYRLTGPMSGLWLLGIVVDLAAEVITGEKGFDSGPAVISALNKTRNSLSTALHKAMDEDADMEDVIAAVFKAEKRTTALTAGVPAWLNDSVQMLYLHSQGDWDAEDTPGILYGQSIEMMNYKKGR